MRECRRCCWSGVLEVPHGWELSSEPDERKWQLGRDWIANLAIQHHYRPPGIRPPASPHCSHVSYGSGKDIFCKQQIVVLYLKLYLRKENPCKVRNLGKVEATLLVGQRHGWCSSYFPLVVLLFSFFRLLVLLFVLIMIFCSFFFPFVLVTVTPNVENTFKQVLSSWGWDNKMIVN